MRSGAERALLARLRHLPEHGIEPAVAFLADGPFREEVESTGVRTVVLAEGPRLRQAARLPGAVRALARVARREGADVIEGCGEKMSLLAGWAARLARCACVYNLQDAPLRAPGPSALQLAGVLGRHDAVVVPSEWMARSFRKLGLRPRVIPNAVVFEDLPDRPGDLRGLAGWPQDSVVVGHFGRLVAWKGADVLLSAAADVPAARFALVGGALYGHEPGYEGRLVERARELGVADRVHFAGHREDALALMLACDVVCHCSLEPEPFGMVVLEAMALGKPVVASRPGAPEELVEGGRTGVLVEPGAPAALGAELNALVASPARRRELGEAARAAARSRYSSAAVSGALGSVYRDVARSRAR